MANPIPVSVIVPVFNGERHLRRTLESLASQTLENMEIIVVDDASVDATLSIARSFESRFDNFILVQNSKNTGVHNARIEGIKRANGLWIGFVDSDDTVSPHTFSDLHESGNRNDADIVVCEAYRADKFGRKVGKKVRLPKDQLILSNIFQHFCSLKFGTGMLWNKLYRREIILPVSKLTFPWKQNTNEDLLVNIGCFYQAKSLYLLKKPLYNYTYRPESVTASMPNELAYTSIYRAYAIAVALYSHLGNDILLNITELYRRQLSFECYQLTNVMELSTNHEALNEATDLILKHYPLGLSLLSSRAESSTCLPRKITLIASTLLSYFNFRSF